MTRRTRNVVVASAVVGLGLGIGLLAYVVRSTTVAAAPGPDEMRFVPATAVMVAFANVREVMTSELRQRMRDGGWLPGTGSDSLQAETGINPETDVDRVLIGALPSPPDTGSGTMPGTGTRSRDLMLARGRFDAVQIERAMRERGAQVEDYKGKRLITANGSGGSGSSSLSGRAAMTVALAFIEPGLVAFGERATVRQAIDAGADATSVLGNTELMNRVKPLDGHTLWAVGRFEALPVPPTLAGGMIGQLPQISWVSASGRIDAGVKANVTAETRDEASANNLRDTVRGLVAIGRMQTAARPEWQALVQSIQIGGTGHAVSVSFDVSPGTLDVLSSGLRPPAGARP